MAHEPLANTSVICTVCQTKPRMVRSQYYPSNCYYMQTLAMVGAPPKIHRCPSCTIGAGYPGSELSSQTDYRSVGNRLY